MNRRMTLGLGLAAVLGLAACGGAKVPADQAWTGLRGVEWVAESMAQGPIIDERAPTFTVDQDGRVSGKAGCNSYGGAAQIEEDRINFGDLFATKMFCEGTMEQEMAFLHSLEQTVQYRIEAGKLALLDGTGSRLVVFHQKPAVP